MSSSPSSTSSAGDANPGKKRRRIIVGDEQRQVLGDQHVEEESKIEWELQWLDTSECKNNEKNPQQQQQQERPKQQQRSPYYGILSVCIPITTTTTSSSSDDDHRQQPLHLLSLCLTGRGTIRRLLAVEADYDDEQQEHDVTVCIDGYPLEGLAQQQQQQQQKKNLSNDDTEKEEEDASYCYYNFDSPLWGGSWVTIRFERRRTRDTTAAASSATKKSRILHHHLFQFELIPDDATTATSTQVWEPTTPTTKAEPETEFGSNDEEEGEEGTRVPRQAIRRTKRKVRPTIVPPTWYDTASTILEDYYINYCNRNRGGVPSTADDGPTATATATATATDNNQLYTILVVGMKKGVGRSTFTRYLINRILGGKRRCGGSSSSSTSTNSCCWLLDGDCTYPQLGQFPGTVNLHRIDQPMLQSQQQKNSTTNTSSSTQQQQRTSCTSQQQQLFFGSTMPSDDPMRYMECIQELLAMVQQQREREKHAAGNNGNGILIVQLPPFLYPYRKGLLGEQLLEALLSQTNANHVVKLVASEKAKAMAATSVMTMNLQQDLQQIRQRDDVEHPIQYYGPQQQQKQLPSSFEQDDIEEEGEDSVSPPSSSESDQQQEQKYASDVAASVAGGSPVSEQLQQQPPAFADDTTTPKPTPTRYHEICPYNFYDGDDDENENDITASLSKTTASAILLWAAPALSTPITALRLHSIASYFCPNVWRNLLVVLSSGTTAGSNSSSSASNTDPGYYNNILERAMDDNTCTLGRTLASEVPYEVPFECVEWGLNNNNVPAAASESSWTPGFGQHHRDYSSENGLLDVMNGSIVGLLSRHRSSSSSGLIHHHLLPCIGFGLVRSIDRTRRIFYIVTPVSHEQLHDVSVLSIGRIELPLEFYYRGVESQGFPYQTIQGPHKPSVVPLGTEPMKSRHNIGRKSLLLNK